jgi:hypothetical protein
MNASPGVRRVLQFGVLAGLLLAGFAVTRRAEQPDAMQSPTPVARPTETSAASLAFPRSEAAAAARPPRLKVAFQLDPTLTQGLYLGQRWVHPPTFDFVQPGVAFVVRAKAQRVDSASERQDVSGDWAASNPEMVAVDRGPGEVKLTIREAGDSDLVVQAAGERNVLHVHAEQRPDAMRVRITQQ